MKPLTLQEVYEQVDKSLFDEVGLFDDIIDFIVFWVDKEEGLYYSLFNNGDFHNRTGDKDETEPQLLEIQKAQRLLLLVGE